MNRRYRKTIIAGNWKMNNTIPEAVVLAQEISNRMERDWLERAVTDYVSGMTDDYAIYQYGEIFIPMAWSVK